MKTYEEVIESLALRAFNSYSYNPLFEAFSSVGTVAFIYEKANREVEEAVENAYIALHEANAEANRIRIANYRK